MRRIALAVVACLLVLAAGCSAPTMPSARPGDFPGNPLDRPVQPRPIGADPAAVDRSCRSDADCAIKDVGNCCGYYPACVNVGAKPDPKAVQAQCAKSGMASVCGFPQISGCRCVKGQCAADTEARAR